MTAEEIIDSDILLQDAVSGYIHTNVCKRVRALKSTESVSDIEILYQIANRGSRQMENYKLLESVTNKLKEAYRSPLLFELTNSAEIWAHRSGNALSTIFNKFLTTEAEWDAVLAIPGKRQPVKKESAPSGT